jgi:ribosomal protein S18 acetylase RimI-like enzyme
MKIDMLETVTDADIDALNHLLPQLSTSFQALQRSDVERILAESATTVLVARDDDGAMLGTLTLVVFSIPTGVRAWIEDVVVDEGARGQHVGEQLVAAALTVAREKGAVTVDLTSRPSRVAAHRLYEKMGFATRDTNVFRRNLN